MRELLVDTCTGKRRTALHTPSSITFWWTRWSWAAACPARAMELRWQDRTEREASVPNITVSVERIDQLLELLRRNCVSPSPCGTWFLIGFKSTRSAMTQGLRAAFD